MFYRIPTSETLPAHSAIMCLLVSFQDSNIQTEQGTHFLNTCNFSLLETNLEKLKIISISKSFSGKIGGKFFF